MKWICLLVFLWQGMLSGMEVRSYQVRKEFFVELAYRGEFSEIDPFGESSVGPNEMGRVLTKSPFESRFLKEGELVWDCSDEVRKLLGKEKWAGLAVIDEKGEQLVVKAEASDHIVIAEIFKRGVQIQVETQVTLYRVEGVTIGRDRRSIEEIEKGQLLAGLTCVHAMGCHYEARSGDFVIKGEMDADVNLEIFENRISWESEIVGSEFQLETGFVVERDEPFIVELGSKDGVSSLVAVMKQDLVLFNGAKFDEWILKEEGGAFLKEERMRDRDVVNLPKIDGVRCFRVSLGALDLDITPLESNTLAPVYEGNAPELARFSKDSRYDIKELFQNSGVPFDEGDFVVFSIPHSTLFVKTSKQSEALIEGIMDGISYPPGLIHFDFVKIESQIEVTSKLENVEVKEKVGVVVLPGQNGNFQLGKGLFGEIEANIDSNDKLVEIRVNLAPKADLSESFFKSGLALRGGTPVVIQQSRVGEKWEAWVVTAEVMEVGAGSK